MPERHGEPSPPATTAHLLQPGEVVDGRYRIEACMGRGAMAAVYRATHLVLEHPVALKVVAAPFVEEARAAAALEGAHVARVFDVAMMADGTPYVVSELLEGSDLGELLASGESPPVEDAVDWVLQACEALAEVHARGMAHGALEPASLFLTRGADGLPCVKLIDFGLAYTADPRCDIWGLGTVLYELLVGHPPLDGRVPAPSSFRDDVPPDLDAVISKCLRTAPDERWTNVAELATALAPFGYEHGMAHAANIARAPAPLHATRAVHFALAAVMLIAASGIAARAKVTPNKLATIASLGDRR
jgi:serine/threonine-protein kinase